jgi:hypothetical protein
MLHAGLDLSRKRLDFCLLDESGERIEISAAPVGFGNSGGLVFMDESAESVATVDGRSSCVRLRWVAAVRR